MRCLKFPETMKIYCYLNKIKSQQTEMFLTHKKPH